MNSVDRFLWWGFERLNRLIKMVTKDFRHLIVKPKPRRDERLRTKRPVGVHPNVIRAQNCQMHGAKVVRENQAVDYNFAAFSQVHENVFWGVGQSPTLSFDCTKYNQGFEAKESISFQIKNLCTIAVLYAVLSPYLSAAWAVLQ